IFIVLSGFATTDLSVRFCDACQGGGAYGKTAMPRPYPCSLWLSVLSSRALIRELRPLAADERQERSD
ncbi:hypothetical protein FPK71_26095, partial [Acinetobacter baumannii]|nr:hypothetical protein [Acinetobacter baumannii]